ncbi:hypothetical protein AKO1_001701, partial [Acrasis kona]
KFNQLRSLTLPIHAAELARKQLIVKAESNHTQYVENEKYQHVVSIDHFRAGIDGFLRRFEEHYTSGLSFFREIVDLTEGPAPRRSSDDESDGDEMMKGKKATPLVNVKQRSEGALKDLKDKESALAAELSNKKKKKKEQATQRLAPKRARASTSYSL